MECYLDNSGTTKPDEAVVQEISNALTIHWGNPSSLHKKGIDAEMCLRTAREQVAKGLGALPQSVYFSPGGTLSIHAALFGGAESGKRRGKRLITTGVEHPAVDNAFNALEKQGFEVVRITPRLDGDGLCEQIEEQVNEETILVSVMQVNNEMGQVFPVERIASRVKRINPKTLIHCDAVQGFMKIPLHLKRTQLDLVSVSGHKIHGPKGIGALYVREGLHIPPVFFGGGQEKGLFPGTENVALSVGLGKAVELLGQDIPARRAHMDKLNRRLREGLKTVPEAFILSPENALPYILCFGLEGIRSEILLHYLEARDIYVSSGSACSKGKKSRVLEAFGISDNRIDSAVRVSFSKDSQEDEVDCLCAVLEDASREIRKR